MKRLIILLAAILALLLCAGACADPAKTDGTVTAWIGEGNELFLKCSDGITRKLSEKIKDILNLTETDVIALTQMNQIVAVKKDGSNYSVLSGYATEEEIAAQAASTFLLEEGKLSVGDSVFSERADAAVTDGLVLYWVNQGDNGFVLMEKEMPGKEQEAFGRAAVSLTGKSVPEPIYLCVTEEALTLTATDHSITVFDLKNGETTVFQASGLETTGACLTGGRLYRYASTDELPWVLEEIRNEAMKLETVTPAPTATPTATAALTATPVPTATPRITATPTHYEEDTNIYYGARGKKIRKIQERLEELGYPVGKVDGVYGKDTQVAVNLFYDAIHAREHNYITQGMYKKLFDKKAPLYDPYMPLKKGDSGLSVRYMQEALKEAGYDPGKIDGVYGTQTVKAMAEYQKKIGYKPGKKEKAGEYASREVLEKLLGPEPTPTPTDKPKPTNKPTGKPTKTPKPTNTSVPASKTDL